MSVQLRCSSHPRQACATHSALSVRPRVYTAARSCSALCMRAAATSEAATPKNVLIVHAHNEPNSFCSSLSKSAADALKEAGHSVTVSDLYQMGFQPVSDRRNFTTTKDPDYLKQQQEEIYAGEKGGFAPDVEAEIKKLEAADALIFSFPLWWFSMPAIMKGWCDKVLAMGRVYGGPKLYEGGVGGTKKPAMVIMTTGGGRALYSGWGFNPPIQAVLTPIHHGIFWFNGFLPLDPFLAWSPTRLSDAERKQLLADCAARAASLFDSPPNQLPRLSEFRDKLLEAKERYIVVVSRKKPADEEYMKLVPAELETIAEWKRSGVLLDFKASVVDDPNWKGFFTMRVNSREELGAKLQELPLAQFLNFDSSLLGPLPGEV